MFCRNDLAELAGKEHDAINKLLDDTTALFDDMDKLNDARDEALLQQAVHVC